MTSEYSVADKIRIATELKDAGNALFQAKKYKEAKRKYYTVFAYINGLGNFGPLTQYANAVDMPQLSIDENDVIDKLQTTCNSNLALCHLNLGNMQKAMEHCDKVLNKHPDHVKALFRKGQIIIKINGDPEEAHAYLMEAAKLEPQNAAIRKEIKNVKRLLKQQEQKQKALYSGMFNK